MNKNIFILLSFTWGLPMTLIGCITASALRFCGYKPIKYYYCWRFEIGHNWGGINLGIFFITDKECDSDTFNHELGHGIQNCFWGFLMPFVIGIPSLIRSKYRELKFKLGYINKTSYYDIWFESQANRLVDKYMKEGKL